jgi:Mitochondrial carrier protein
MIHQLAGCPTAYKGVSDCFYRILKEEGVGAFYRSLPPRLMSVVPMIAIQFGVYETLKTKFLFYNKEQRILTAAALKLKASKVRTSAVALATKAKKSAKVSLHKDKAPSLSVPVLQS